MRKYSKLLAIMLAVSMLLPGIAQAVPVPAEDQVNNRVENAPTNEEIDAAVNAANKAIEELDGKLVTNGNKKEVTKEIVEARKLIALAEELDKNVVFDTYPLEQLDKQIADLGNDEEEPQEPEEPEEPEEPNNDKPTNEEIDIAVNKANEAIKGLDGKIVTNLNKKQVINQISEARRLIEFAKGLDKNVVFNTYPLDQLQIQIDNLEDDEEEPEDPSAVEFISLTRAEISGLNRAVAQEEDLDAKQALIDAAQANLNHAAELGMEVAEVAHYQAMIDGAQRQVDYDREQSDKYAAKVTAAIEAVEKAEASKLQEDIDAARLLVKVLKESDIKTDLTNRLDSIVVTPEQETRRGNVQFVKTDVEDNLLDSAEFGLFKKSDIEFEEVVQKQISNGYGEVQFDEVLLGEYVLKELTAPEGYELSNETLRVNITEEGKTIDLGKFYNIKEVVEVDKSALEYLIASTGDALHNPEGYTEESYNTLLEEHDAAMGVLENEDATQEEVNAAIVSLQAAIDALVEVEEPKVDKAELENLIRSTGNILQNPNEYTEKSYNNLLEVHDEAMAVLDNEDATQDEVDLAKENLQIAIDNLELRSVKEDKEAAAYFDKLMAGFTEKGEITSAYIAKVQKAREVYDSLSENAKKLTRPSNIGKLKRVEARIAQYQAEQELLAQAISAVEEFEAKVATKDQVLELVSNKELKQEVSASFTPAFNKIQDVKDKEKKQELLDRLNAANDKVIAAGFVNGLKTAVENLTEDNLFQTKIRLTSTRGNVGSLPDGEIKDALIDLIRLEEAKIVKFEEDLKNAKVTLDLDGGTVKDGAETEFEVKKGNKFELPHPIILQLKKERYTFKGWMNTTTEVVVPASSREVTVTEDVTYKAVWEETKGTVTLYVYSDKPAEKIPSKITLIAEDGTSYEMKSDSYGANDRTWKLNDKIKNGNYKLEFEGLKDNTLITLKGYPLSVNLNRGSSEITPTTGDENDEYNVEFKFLDDSPVVSARIDMTIVDVDAGIAEAASTLLDQVELATNIADANKLINDAYKEIKKLPAGEVKTALTKRMNDLSTMVAMWSIHESYITTELANSVRLATTAKRAQTLVDDAQTRIDEIEGGYDKTALQNIVDAQQLIVDAMVENEEAAIASVVKAEASKLQADVDAAKALVGALPNSKDKTALLNRLEAVQETIDSATDKEEAVKFDKLMSRITEKGEITEDYMAKVESAREAYDALSDEAKNLVNPANLAKLKKIEARIAKYKADIEAAEELTTAKEKAQKELNDMFSKYLASGNYTGDNNEELIAIQEQFIKDKNVATSVEEVEELLKNALADLAAVKTDADVAEEFDRKAASSFDKLMSRITEKGELTEDYIAKVQAAREGYEALSENAKTLVRPGNLYKLKRIEARIAQYEEDLKNAKVNLDLNGGTAEAGAVTEFIVEKGSKLELPHRVTLKLKKEGYTFRGWKNKTTEVIVPSYSREVTVTEDVTYEAVWEETEGEVNVHVFSRRPDLKIPTEINLIDKDGIRYELKSSSWGANDRTWRTTEKLLNGEYTLEFKGLGKYNITAINLTTAGGHSSTLTTTQVGEESVYSLNLKFEDDNLVSFTRIDMAIEESEEDRIIAEAQEAVDGARQRLVKARTLEQANAVINEAYAKVKKLVFGSPLRTELNNRLVVLSENNALIRLLEEKDYIDELAKDRSASQAQTTLNNLQKEVDKIITTVFKTKYQNLINEQQKNVDDMLIATEAVVKAGKSQLQTDLNNAQELVNELVEGNVKLILSASNAVTNAEISRSETDITSARALVAGLPYQKEKTPLEKRLDAIVVAPEDASVVKTEQEFKTALGNSKIKTIIFDSNIEFPNIKTVAGRILIDRSVTLEGKGMSINTGLTISNNAQVKINNLNFDLAGEWLQDSGAQSIVIDITSGKVVAKNIKINFTREKAKRSDIIGVNIRQNQVLEIFNSEFTLGEKTGPKDQANIIGVNGQTDSDGYDIDNGITGKVINNIFNLNGERQKVSIGIGLERKLNANMTVSGNTLNSNSEENNYNIRLYTAKGISEAELHAFADTMLDAGHKAYIYNKVAYYVYPIAE